MRFIVLLSLILTISCAINSQPSPKLDDDILIPQKERKIYATIDTSFTEAFNTTTTDYEFPIEHRLSVTE